MFSSVLLHLQYIMVHG